MEREHISRDRQTDRQTDITHRGSLCAGYHCLIKQPGAPRSKMTLVAFNKCVRGERERENISLEREREIERGGGREICYCPGQRSCSLNKRLTIQTLLTCRRER